VVVEGDSSWCYVEVMMIEDLKVLTRLKGHVEVFGIATVILSACVHVLTLSSHSGFLVSEELQFH
jgi:hypothetical protein